MIAVRKPDDVSIFVTNGPLNVVLRQRGIAVHRDDGSGSVLHMGSDPGVGVARYQIF